MADSNPTKQSDRTRLTFEEAFWSKVIKRDSDHCWLWQGYRGTDGYGAFRFDHITRLAHRVAYELAVGPIPDGLWVLHRCDRTACVRPDHLFLGNNADNMADMVAKGRSLHGTRSPRAKLTEQSVEAIREIQKSGAMTQRKLAVLFGVSKSTISEIVRGAKWKHGLPTDSNSEKPVTAYIDLRRNGGHCIYLTLYNLSAFLLDPSPTRRKIGLNAEGGTFYLFDPS
jgi:DNA-binding transcriptional regulator YiaG